MVKRLKLKRPVKTGKYLPQILQRKALYETNKKHCKKLYFTYQFAHIQRELSIAILEKIFELLLVMSCLSAPHWEKTLLRDIAKEKKLEKLKIVQYNII